MYKFNEYEKALIKVIEEAQEYCKGELELDFYNDHEEEHLNGWYAMDYRPEYESAFFIHENGYGEKPLISGETADKNNVNVVKCCDYCDISYVY